MRVFQWVLDNPKDVQKQVLPSLPHLNKFYKSPTTDNYIKGLADSLNLLSVSSMSSPSGVKQRLANIHDSRESEEPPKKIPKKLKNVKKDFLL